MLLHLLSVMAVIVTAMPNDVMPREVFLDVGEYFYIGAPMNWTEAVLLCQASDAHLAIIDSVAEAAVIRDMMTNHGATFIHLGFHDQFIEGKYNNMIDRPINWPGTTGNEWAVGSPRGGTTYNCGGFSEAGLTDIACGDLNKFICEVPTAQVEYPGYTLVPNFGYYKFTNSPVTWPKAAEACRQDGTHLVIFNSQEEVNAVISSFNITDYFATYVGVHRFYGGTDNFVTILGGYLKDTGYTTWAPGEPKGTYTTEPCVYYANGPTVKGLTAMSCGAGIRYFCEGYN